jgi:hypothetical protein
MFLKLLIKLGHVEEYRKGTTMVFKSPFNPNERTASFFLFLNENWLKSDPLKYYNYKDYSTGRGGDIYNFTMEYFNIGFVEAKNKIQEILNKPYPSNKKEYNSKTIPQNNKIKAKKNNKAKDVIIKPLEHRALLTYLLDRKISIDVARKYLNEVRFKIGDKKYFALSFYNKSNGIETRNIYFKGCLGKKDISILLLNKQDKRLKIFEGFIDFLSYLEINKKAKLSNYLILNSVSLKEKAIDEVKGRFLKYELYLDNDRAGDDTTKYLQQELQNTVDKRAYYKKYKDINDFLISEYKM